MLKDRQIKVAKLATECGTSNGRFYAIVHEHLGMSKSICQVGTQKPEQARSSAKGRVDQVKNIRKCTMSIHKTFTLVF